MLPTICLYFHRFGFLFWCSRLDIKNKSNCVAKNYMAWDELFFSQDPCVLIVRWWGWPHARQGSSTCTHELCFLCWTLGTWTHTTSSLWFPLITQSFLMFLFYFFALHVSTLLILLPTLTIVSQSDATSGSLPLLTLGVCCGASGLRNCRSSKWPVFIPLFRNLWLYFHTHYNS
jgi:hypothetical protein